MVSFIHPLNVLARLIVSIANIPLVHYLLNLSLTVVSHLNIDIHGAFIFMVKGVFMNKYNY
jgi:hypothetical protein